MDHEKVIVIDFGGQYNQLVRDVSENAMFTVRYIPTRRISRRSRQ